MPKQRKIKLRFRYRNNMMKNETLIYFMVNNNYYTYIRTSLIIMSLILKSKLFLIYCIVQDQL